MAKHPEESVSHGSTMTVGRLETLIDGIFAIAMTLLVFNFKVPEGASSAADFNRRLLDLWPQFWTFGQSFLLLGIFWATSNRQSRFIERTDQAHLWIHIVWLMFVALVPFSTSLLARYNRYVVCALLFHTNLLFISLFFYWNWRRAINRRLLHQSVSVGIIRMMGRRNLIFPAASLFALGLSFATPLWSSLAYLLIPCMLRLVTRKPVK